MRSTIDIARSAASLARYSAARARLRGSHDAADSLSPIFGQVVQSLPRSLRLELVAPELQAFTARRDFFIKLRELGVTALQLRLNEYLGTQSIQLDEALINSYARTNRLSSLLIVSPRVNKRTYDLDARTDALATNLLVQCIGAVETMIGPEESKIMVNDNILAGRDGLASLYLESLSRTSS